MKSQDSQVPVCEVPGIWDLGDRPVGQLLWWRGSPAEALRRECLLEEQREG